MRRGIALRTAIALTFVLGLCSVVYPAETGRPVLHRAEPVYPPLARQMRLGGSVILVISIEPNGTVSDAKVQSGHPLLVRAATDAVRQWKFASATSATAETVCITFELR